MRERETETYRGNDCSYGTLGREEYTAIISVITSVTAWSQVPPPLHSSLPVRKNLNSSEDSKMSPRLSRQTNKSHLQLVYLGPIHNRKALSWIVVKCLFIPNCPVTSNEGAFGSEKWNNSTTTPVDLHKQDRLCYHVFFMFIEGKNTWWNSWIGWSKLHVALKVCHAWVSKAKQMHNITHWHSLNHNF